MDKYRSALFKSLINEAARVVLEPLGKNTKAQGGVVAALHTFGSKLAFNPLWSVFANCLNWTSE